MILNHLLKIDLYIHYSVLSSFLFFLILLAITLILPGTFLLFGSILNKLIQYLFRGICHHLFNTNSIGVYKKFGNRVVKQDDKFMYFEGTADDFHEVSGDIDVLLSCFFDRAI